MNLIKTLALLICSLGISNVCLANSDVLSLEETIKLSSNIVKATPIFEQKVKIREYIEITIWEFKILKEFKGETVSIIDLAELFHGDNDFTKSIIVVSPLGLHLPNGKKPLHSIFKKEKEYILLLNEVKPQYIYTLKTSHKADNESSQALIKKVIELNKDK